MFDSLKSMIEFVFGSDVSTISNVLLICYIFFSIVYKLLKGRKND